MKNVIVTGATGMIGSLVLRQCLERSDVASVTSIVRHRSGVEHPKLREIEHQDFLDFSGITEHFEDQDICFYCLGVYTGQVDSQTFRKITVDFTSAFADALARRSTEVVFCYLSGQGADQTEKSRFMFARDKGAAENKLFRAGFKRTHTFRPGYIYPVEPRDEPNLSYRIMRILYKPVSTIYPNVGLTSVELAKAMVKVAFGHHHQSILENRNIRRSHV